MNKYTDEQLKRAADEMVSKLPNISTRYLSGTLYWVVNGNPVREVLDSEMLQLCWEAEETLTLLERSLYAFKIISMVISNLDFEVTYCSFSWRQIFHCLHMSWQQRIPPLAAVKGITI